MKSRSPSARRSSSTASVREAGIGVVRVAGTENGHDGEAVDRHGTILKAGGDPFDRGETPRFPGGDVATRGGVSRARGKTLATRGGVPATPGNVVATRGEDVTTPGRAAATRGEVVATPGNVVATRGEDVTAVQKVSAARGEDLAGDFREKIPATSVLARVYRVSLSLLNDLYELTRAYARWKEGVAGRQRRSSSCPYKQ
jgi:hypothetical protein